MRRVWRMLLGLCDRTILEDVEYDEDAGAIVAHVRPKRPKHKRCGKCGRRSPGYDSGEGRRQWRALDLGVMKAFVEADAPRVDCRVHGVTVIRSRGLGTTRGLLRRSKSRWRGWRCTHRSRR